MCWLAGMAGMLIAANVIAWLCCMQLCSIFLVWLSAWTLEWKFLLGKLVLGSGFVAGLLY